MHNALDDLIKRARPHTPPAAGTLAVVSGRGMVHGVGAAAWMLRAAALITLAAGVGALTAWLSQGLVGTPAAGDTLDVAIERRLTALESVVDLHERLAAAKREYVDAAVESAVREALARQDARERERWQQRHIAHVRRRFARDMELTLAGLREQGLAEDKLAQAHAILSEHGRRAEELILSVYSRTERRAGFQSLARETEELLRRATGQDQWHDVLGADPQHWAPNAEYEDWSDFDSHLHWLRSTSRS